jgi:hypothetical protein
MYLKLKYLRMLGLKGYEEKPREVVFSCPLCGDGKKRMNSRRGYILGVQNEITTYYCHNQCCHGISFYEFLKRVNYSYYLDYKRERFKQDFLNFGQKKEEITEIKIERITDRQKDTTLFDKYLKSLSELPEGNRGKIYLNSRNINSIHHNNVYYFNGNPYKLFQTIFKDERYKEKAIKYLLHEGVIIPFIDKDQAVRGFGMRFINKKSNFRFLNLFSNGDNTTFLFGENKCNFNKPIIVLEGMIDKITFKQDKQVLSMISSNLKLDYVKSLAKNTVTYVFDYEFLNKHIYSKILQAIRAGFDVCLWNSKAVKCKDINDLKDRYKWDDKQLLKFVLGNSYNGLEAEIKLNQKYKEQCEALIYKVGG